MTTSASDFLSSAFATFPAALPTLVILLKITGLLILALGASLVMQRASAGSRHLVWLVALAALLALPALALWAPLPIRVLPALPAADLASSATDAVVPPGPNRIIAPVTGGATGLTESSAESPASPDLGTVLLGLWALGAIGLLARLGYGAWSVRRIVRGARTLEHPDWQGPLYEIADRLGLETAPRLLQSDEVKMPFAAGLLVSSIVLPADSEGWSADRRSAVLIHELGHVRRRDLVGHTLSRVVCALYWFHPLVWTAARQLRAESERACDDLALVFGARPSDYAEHLLDIVTCVRDHNTPAIALAMAHRKEFEGRMLAILNPELTRKGPGRMQAASLVASLAAMALVVGAAAPVPRTAAAVVTPPSPRSQPMASLGDTAPRPVSLPTVPRTGKPAQAANPSPALPANPNPAQAANPTPAPAANPTASIAALQTARTDDERVAVLARALRGDSSAKVRRVAAWGLQRYAQVDVAQDALIAAASGDADAEVREMSAWALAGARRSSAASMALVSLIRKEKNSEVRATAVWAAGMIGDPAAVEALSGALADADPDVREMAAWSIGNCRPDKAPAAVTKALSDQDRDVRISAAWALYMIHDPEAAPAIDAAFRHETDPEVQRGLIQALGRMGDQSVETLQRLVSSPSPEVREAAVSALAGAGSLGPWPWPRPQPRPFP